MRRWMEGVWKVGVAEDPGRLLRLIRKVGNGWRVERVGTDTGRVKRVGTEAGRVERVDTEAGRRRCPRRELAFLSVRSG